MLTIVFVSEIRDRRVPGDEVVRQGRGVGDALQNGVHVARVAQVLQARQPGLLRAPDSSEVPV